MARLFLDVNVLVDYAGVSCTEDDHSSAVQLVEAGLQRGCDFFVTPTVLKDFAYLTAAAIKRDIRTETGALTSEQAHTARKLAHGVLETIMGLCTTASEGIGECEMARLLCATHDDFEDNLLAATALRIGADCIVTRDVAFAKHCAIACLEPADAAACLEAGVWPA